MKTANPSESANTLFKRHFGYPPTHLVKAPGRLDLLGDSTGDHEGLVMTVAVDKYISIASAPRTDGRIELVSSDFPERELFWMSEIRKNPVVSWVDPVKGVLAQLRKRGVHFSGFSAAVHGTIPMDAGMGDRAALEVGTALTVRRLYPFSLTETGATVPPKRNEHGELPPLATSERWHYARLCCAAETEFLGARCGLPDHVTCLLGKAWHAINLDCRFHSVEHAPLIGEVLVLCDPGIGNGPASGNDADVQENCESAARKLHARSLRSVELKHLQACRSSLTPREYECACHVVGEAARVVAGERALREDDHRQFGQYLLQSHESARDFLKASGPEADLLVDLARRHRGCLGARRIGSGPGSGTLSLVACHQAEDFMETIAREYEERIGNGINPVVCQIVDGAA